MRYATIAVISLLGCATETSSNPKGDAEPPAGGAQDTNSAASIDVNGASGIERASGLHDAAAAEAAGVEEVIIAGPAPGRVDAMGKAIAPDLDRGALQLQERERVLQAGKVVEHRVIQEHGRSITAEELRTLKSLAPADLFQ